MRENVTMMSTYAHTYTRTDSRREGGETAREVPNMHPAFVLVERDRDDQWSCSSKTLDVSIV